MTDFGKPTADDQTNSNSKHTSSSNTVQSEPKTDEEFANIVFSADEKLAAPKDDVPLEKSAWTVLDRKYIDYSDPKMLRRMWIQQRTDLTKRYRPGLRFNLSEPLIAPRMTKASFLRERQVEIEKINKKNLKAQLERQGQVGREVPKYRQVWPNQNITSHFRYKNVRNMPPVSSNYIEHYEKYKKPPFKAGCLPRC